MSILLYTNNMPLLINNSGCKALIFPLLDKQCIFYNHLLMCFPHGSPHLFIYLLNLSISFYQYHHKHRHTPPLQNTLFPTSLLAHKTQHNTTLHPPSSPSFTISNWTTKLRHGEVLKGARSPAHTRMEGGFCQLLAAQEADKEDQALKGPQATPACRGWLWSLHFRFPSLPCQQNRLPRFLWWQQQHHSGNSIQVEYDQYNILVHGFLFSSIVISGS